MKVKELLDSFKGLKKVSFILNDCQIEEVDCYAPGSWKAIRKHYNEKVIRVFAIGEDEIRIDSI